MRGCYYIICSELLAVAIHMQLNTISESTSKSDGMDGPLELVLLFYCQQLLI